MIEIVFGAFALLSLLLFRFTDPARAVIIICLGGWILLPVGHFPATGIITAFPDWITGTAVPSDMLLTKMWWPPVVAGAGVLLFDRGALLRWRPGLIDLPMLLWCLWPLGQWALVDQPSPPAWIASLYLFGTWGMPWLLGRLYAAPENGRFLLVALTAGLAVLLPIALLEGVRGPVIYDWIYEIHPYNREGIDRYIGYRPLAFFEHGNQYGIWVAMTALAAVWLWHAAPDKRMRTREAMIAALACGIALIAQSAGAIVLMMLGLIIMGLAGRSFFRWMLPAALLVSAAGGALYISGALPLRAIATSTSIGREIVGAFATTGRSSFIYRMARDQEALPLIMQHPLAGSGHWDWWRVNGRRPWGLAVQVIGQFGLIGLLLSFGALLFPALRALTQRPARPKDRSNDHSVAMPLGVIVLMAMGDALLNSFLFYPAILAAGALAAPKR